MKKALFVAALTILGAVFSPVISASTILINPMTINYSKEGNPVVGKPPFRRIFLDATVVEESNGLDRVFHQLEKHPDNPIIPKDKPWEGWGPYLYGTVLWDQDKLRMWYESVGDGQRICYAESTDGLNWEKPELGLIEYRGSKANNIVVEGQCHIASVMRTAYAEFDKQYMMYGYGPNGANFAFSYNGLEWFWHRLPDGEQLFSSEDVLNFFHDPYQSQYVCTFKLADRRHRSVGLVTSSDGFKWTKLMEHPIFTADDLDPDATQIYGMPVFPYQGCYIGMPWIYHARFFKYGAYSNQRMYEAQEDSPRTIDVQLAWSWNLVNWTRTPERKPFLPLGPEGSWDDGMVFTATAPVVVDDKLYFYYGGFDQLHDDGREINGAIGLATLRLDGFCSMQAGSDEGWVITRREMFRTPKVTINARTSEDGYVVAEIVDRHNRVLPGFSREDCISFKGDSLSYLLEWKTAEFPEEMLSPDKKIRFILKNADLYSYLPSDINERGD